MRTNGARWAIVLFGAMLLLGGCAHRQPDADATGDDGINAFPTNYKSDILAALHAYLNDPTGVRDGSLSPPVLKSVGDVKHYVACLRFNAKKSGKDYAGVKEIAAVFIAGRFDRFIDTASEFCTGVTYSPFPEIGTLTR